MSNFGLLAALSTRKAPGTGLKLEPAQSVAALHMALSERDPRENTAWIVGTRPHVLDHPDSLLLVAGNLRGAGDADWWKPGDVRFERLRTDLKANSAAALAPLRGPFLLAFFDRLSGAALFAIDRAGITALCFAVTAAGDLLVATDATLLRQHPGLRVELDSQALYNFLYFHMVPSPGSIFRGVRKLEPAQFLQWSPTGSLHVRSWWKPTFRDRDDGDGTQLRGELIPALTNAVRRWRASPGVGTFLSGGIDSSTVTGLVARELGPAAAYSMGFSAAGYDEAHYARIAADHFGARLKLFYVEPDHVAAELFNVARAYDEPFGNSSAVPTLLCARYARGDGAQTLLAGDGGDELYAGNERYARQKVFEWYHGIPSALRAGLIEPLFGDPSRARIWPLSKIAAYVSQARQPMPDRLQSYNFLNRPESSAMFESGFLCAVDAAQPAALLRRTYADLEAHNLVDRMLHLDWKFTLADNDLRKVGRMCELGGVAVHYPWLDEDVVDLSLRLAGNTKMRGLKLRTFAKQALTGFLPEAVLTKTKHGFGLPFGEWLKTSSALQSVVYDLLGRFKPRGIVRPEFIDDLIRQHRDGHAAYFGTPVWIIAMLEAWLESHGLES